MALTVHNLHYYRQWMERIRGAISVGNLENFVKESPGSCGE
jgi:tRNA-guanine family transglycosylase